MSAPDIFGMAEQQKTDCTIPPSGWSCTRVAGHDGPCAAVPTENVNPTLEDAFRAGFAAAEEALGAHGSDRLLQSIEAAWSEYASDNALAHSDASEGGGKS